MRVKCPRCGKTLYGYEGESDAECTCHLYCVDGDKPSDCTLVTHTSGTVDAWKGNWNWPMGMHLNQDHGGEDTRARVSYCTTHGKYVDKVPFLVKLDWTRFQSKRASKRLRWHKGVI